jgi:hypothetical protein
MSEITVAQCRNNEITESGIGLCVGVSGRGVRQGCQAGVSGRPSFAAGFVFWIWSEGIFAFVKVLQQFHRGFALDARHALNELINQFLGKMKPRVSSLRSRRLRPLDHRDPLEHSVFHLAKSCSSSTLLHHQSSQSSSY